MEFFLARWRSLALLALLPALCLVAVSLAAEPGEPAGIFNPPKPAVVLDGTWIVMQTGEVVEQPEVVTLLKTSATGQYDVILYPSKGRPSNFRVLVSTDAVPPVPAPTPPKPPAPQPLPDLSATARAAYDLGKLHAKHEAERFAAAAAAPPGTAGELAAMLLARDKVARKAYEAKLLELLRPLGDESLPGDAGQRLKEIAQGFAEAAK